MKSSLHLLPKCALITKELFNLLLVICVLSTCCINFVYSHVSLSFPKARKYDFDFLDNGRTKGPCGMPKGTDRTSLPAGVQFNVTWHLAYPHRGGFRLELLDPSEKLILNLTQSTINPSNNWIKDDDVTAQSYPVTLPKTLVCRGCTIRLLRQASEWGDKYTFWSCADVDIIPVTAIVTSKNAVCSGNGKFDKELSACRCNRPYSGIVCQFLDECWTDEDCGNHGKCIRMNSTFPTRQCFCKLGWFGDKCSKESTIKTTEIDLKAHYHRELTKGYDLYWRIIKESEEIEVVLKLTGKGYAAIGWRPQNITKACKAFPYLVDSKGTSELISPRNSLINPSSQPLNPSASNRRADILNPNESSPTFKKIKVSSPGGLNAAASRIASETSNPKSGTNVTQGSRQPKSSEDLMGGSLLSVSPAPESEPESVTVVVSSSSEPTSSSSTTTSAPEPIPEAEAVPEPKVTPEAEPESNKIKSEPEPESKVEPESEPESTKSPVPESEAEPFAEPETEPSVSVEPEAKPSSSLRNPKSFNQSDEAAPEAEAEAKAETKLLASPEPSAEVEPTKAESASEPEVKSEPEPEPLDEPTSEPEPKVTTEPQPEVKAESIATEPKSEVEPQPSTEPESEPETVPSTSSSSSTNGNKASFIPGSYSPVELDSEIKIRTKRQSPDSDTAFIGGASPVKPRRATDGWQSTDYPPATDYTPKADFHAMDCNDIVIGSAIGEYGRVLDHYTRDRSTPRLDSLFGGKDDLTAAAAFEFNGTTTIIFRKKLIAEELTDHSVINKTMDVIWAKGQEHNKYVHNPPSGLEQGKAKNPHFYGQAEIKYHGHGDQRGKAQINFYEAPEIEKQPEIISKNATLVNSVAPSCNGEFRYPNGCKGRACDYIASWKYSDEQDVIDFAISAKRVDKWTGIGFSKDRKMSKSDAVIAWVEPGGRYLMMDAWLEGYTPPKPDYRQSIFNISALAENGLITFKFSRKLDTQDAKHDVSLSECVYFFYPVSGGPVDPSRKNILAHLQKPLISKDTICLDKCRPQPVPEPESKSNGSVKPATKPQPGTISGPTSKHGVVPEPEGKPEPEPETKPEPKPEPESEPKAESKPEPNSVPKGEPIPKSEPGVEASSVPEPSPEASSTPSSVEKIETRYGTVCSGEWKYPAGCTGYGCDYQITWEYLDDTDEIMFNLQTKNTNRWTGIGFSNNKAMPNTDVILGLVEESGRFFLMDTWLDAYTSPPLDKKQDIHNSTAWRENGITHLKFYRFRKTNDPKDFEFNDSTCPYFVFPIRGGVFNAVNKRIRKHEAVPIISEDRVCVKSCKPKLPSSPAPAPAPVPIPVSSSPKPEVEPEPEDSKPEIKPPTVDSDVQPEKPSEAKQPQSEKTTQKPPESSSVATSVVKDLPVTTVKAEDNDVSSDETMVILEIKMPNAWKSSLSQRSSPDYRKLMTKLEDQLEKELQDAGQLPKQIEVTDISGIGENGVLATVKVEVANVTESRARYDKPITSIREALNETIKDGKVGNLIVDPSYLIFKSPELLDTSGETSDTKKAGLSSEQLTYLAIIVGLSSLVILCISQALCMVWRDKSNKEKKLKEKAIVNSHYKDYSATTTSSAYSYENFAVQDDPDGIGYKPIGAKVNGNTKSDAGNKKKGSKGSTNGLSNFNSATVDRTDSKTSTFGYPSAYATHDRKDNTFRYISQPQPLTPDYYFMPHQRRYSGEVVRVFVDYNNPQFIPK